MVTLTKNHFETDAYKQFYITEWNTTSFKSLLKKNENTSKSQLDILELLFDNLRKIQQCLPNVYHSDLTLRDQIINACESVPECEKALFRPAPTSEGVCADLRNAVRLKVNHEATSQFSNSNTFIDSHEYGNHWTDRQYGGQINRRDRGGQSSRIKGIEEDDNYSDTDQCLMEINDRELHNDTCENFTTELAGDINGHETITILYNQSL
ncbi:integrase and RNaseH domain-containing protein [Erysiphe neolycopersici]|uniref:Integrase and RNaseH domain-containing protein n=1 Tax=Erysiphe neolycopersici TaxID=212602 RepID=A0A420HZ18_9PEZI|nr:integrase and RNaseH domain-containing protein [Erysiphe neolycopersici]